MKKRLRVFAAIIMIAFALMAVMSGCGGGTDKNGDKSSTTAAESQAKVSDTSSPSEKLEPITFDFFVNASWYQWPEWGTNTVSKMIQEETGVTLNFIIPNSSDNQQMNLLLASGDLPDYVWNDIPNPTFKKSINAGVFEDIKALAQANAPEMIERLGDGFFKLNQSPDGKNYYFANAQIRPDNLDRYLSVGPWNPAQLVREDIYKELGSPKLDTPEDLLQVLKTVKGKYPDIIPILIAPTATQNAFSFNGQPFGFQQLLANFGVEKYYDNDGKLYASYKDPKYMDGLKFINKLYKEGIIKRQDMALTADQHKGIKESGKCFYLLGDVGDGYYAPPSNRDVKYLYVPMFKDAKILQQNSLAWGGWFITKDCKDKERAIKFMSYMISDKVEKLTTWGIEGETWEMVDGLPQLTAKEVQARKDDPDQTLKTGVGRYWFNLDLYDHVLQKASMDNNPEQKEALGMYTPNASIKMYLLVPPPDSEQEEAVILQKISTEFNVAFPTFVMAENEDELTKRYNEFLQKADDMGMPKLEAYWSKEAEVMRSAFK